MIELQNNLGKANADLKAAQSKLARLEKTPVSEIALAALVQSDPVCIKQLEIIADLQKKLNEKKRNDLTEEEKGELARLTDQLNTTERDFEVRKNELRELMKNSRRADIEENIAAQRDKLDIEAMARPRITIESEAIPERK